jgi:hypothetical protein
MSLRSLLAVLTLLVSQAFAAGHGPVFGFATPVNSEDEVSFDFGVQGRANGSDSELAIRPMVGYGITPHLTVNVLTPAAPVSNNFSPSRLIGGSEFEGDVAWRFHHQAKGVGKRFESTLFAGIVQPVATGSGLLGSLTRPPGFTAAVASGVASRSHYLWFGAGYTGFLETDGDRRPHVFSYSAVYGFRPSVLRKDYPFWDWRGFVELTGERSNRVVSNDVSLPGTEAHQVFIGPSVLGIYKNYAISGGVQFPVYQAVGPAFAKERVRVAINFSYFLFRQKHQEH